MLTIRWLVPVVAVAIAYLLPTTAGHLIATACEQACLNAYCIMRGRAWLREVEGRGGGGRRHCYGPPPLPPPSSTCFLCNFYPSPTPPHPTAPHPSLLHLILVNLPLLLPPLLPVEQLRPFLLWSMSQTTSSCSSSGSSAPPARPPGSTTDLRPDAPGWQKQGQGQAPWLPPTTGSPLPLPSLPLDPHTLLVLCAPNGRLTGQAAAMAGGLGFHRCVCSRGGGGGGHLGGQVGVGGLMLWARMCVYACPGRGGGACARLITLHLVELLDTLHLVGLLLDTLHLVDCWDFGSACLLLSCSLSPPNLPSNL